MVIKKWNGSSWVATYPDIQIGNIETTGTPSSTTFLRGDGAWAVPNYSSGDITGITAGTGLTGGGTSGSPTINAIGGTGITANANDLAISSQFSPRTAMELPSSQDLNDLKGAQSGFYYQTANADTTGNNYPSGEAGSLLVQRSAGQVTQTYITYSTTPKVFVRTYYTSWSSWKRLFTDDYHPNADKLTTARNIALTGAVTGNANFDGSGNVSISTSATSDPTLTLSGDVTGSATFTNLGNATLTTTVANNSHTHTIANITNLQTTLNAKQDSFGDVSTTILPSNGQVLKWNASASEWQPGDDLDTNTDTNTRRAIEVNGTQILSSTSTTPLDLKAGSGISISNSGGDVTITSSGVTNNVAGATFQNAYAAPGGGSNTGVLLYGDFYGWHTRAIGSTNQVLTVTSGTPSWVDNSGGWTEIKTGTSSVSGATVTNVTLSEAIGDTDVIAFELNTSSATSITSQVHIVKIENSSSVYGGVLYNAYASSSTIRTGSIRVYRGANTTTLSFSYAYYFTNGSSSETSDFVYIGKIWKLKGRTGV